MLPFLHGRYNVYYELEKDEVKIKQIALHEGNISMSPGVIYEAIN